MTGYKNFNREAFHKAEEELKREGHTVLNPAVLPDGLTQLQYMGYLHGDDTLRGCDLYAEWLAAVGRC